MAAGEQAAQKPTLPYASLEFFLIREGFLIISLISLPKLFFLFATAG
jgi:hypothetical protein